MIAVSAPLHRQSVDVAATIRELEAELRARRPDRTVEIHVDEPCVAHADAALLRAALASLLETAWQLTRKRAVGHVDVGCLAGPDGRAYFVRDDGLGSARADDSGLAEVASVVARHGGRLWTEATPGAGATVYFTLGAEDA